MKPEYKANMKFVTLICLSYALELSFKMNLNNLITAKLKLINPVIEPKTKCLSTANCNN